jgi:hypothetical protein
MRTIKEEQVGRTEYRDYADARRQLGRVLDAVYNRKRIHSALGHLPRRSSSSSGWPTAPGRRTYRKEWLLATPASQPGHARAVRDLPIRAPTFSPSGVYPLGGDQ